MIYRCYILQKSQYVFAHRVVDLHWSGGWCSARSIEESSRLDLEEVVGASGRSIDVLSRIWDWLVELWIC